MIDEVPTQMVFILALMALLAMVVGFGAWQRDQVAAGVAQEVAWDLAGTIDAITGLGVPISVTLDPGTDFPTTIVGETYRIVVTNTAIIISGHQAILTSPVHLWPGDDPVYSNEEVRAYDAETPLLTGISTGPITITSVASELDGAPWLVASVYLTAG